MAPSVCPVDPAYWHQCGGGCNPVDPDRHVVDVVPFQRDPLGFKLLWDGGCDAGLRKLIALVSA